MRIAQPAGVLLALLLAGCGTTVPNASSQLSAAGMGVGGIGNDLSQPANTSTGSSLGTPNGAGTNVASGSSGVPNAASGTGPATVGSSNTSVTSGPLGTGDHTPITVGFEVIQGGNQFIATAFSTPVNFGDGQKEITAIVNDINVHGGINGHPIKPVFANWDAASGDNGRQADCATLTDDDHAQFVITVININSAFLACVASHGVPVINTSLGAGDDYLYRTYGANFYSPSLMSLNRESSLLLHRLTDRHILTPGHKVGVVIDGTDPQYTRVWNETEVPTLKALGLPYDYYTVAETADVNSAVLRFRAENIGQVVFIAPNGIIATLFMQSAEQQQYRPTYGMGDSTAAWFVAKAAPAAQVKGFQGVGSLPMSNVEVSQYPTTAREHACLNLIAKQGETDTDRHTSITATVYCEGIYAWAAVAKLINGPITAAAWRAAYPRLGTSYMPITTFAIDFGNRQHGNVAGYRDLGWSNPCSCVTYISSLRPMPPS